MELELCDPPSLSLPLSLSLQVMELMSSFLEVSQSEIKEAVRRDRCDWMAAIYNLLIDQPDGRVVMQRWERNRNKTGFQNL